MKNVKILEPSDAHHLQAAFGWFELGDHHEAGKELEKINPELCNHPDILQLRWEILAKSKQWEAALDVGRALAEAAPDLVTGWVNQAYALHELKRTKEAWETLLLQAEKFGNFTTVPYNLACYASQLGQWTEAEKWIQKAFELGGRECKLMALDDPDLKPLWQHQQIS